MSEALLDDPELLRRIQALLLKMLKDFDDTCRRLDIPYSVYGGTMIGAIRHQGFIPWDDDVDVLMTRANYERFLAEAPRSCRTTTRSTTPGPAPSTPSCSPNSV